jgi:hypothetical protein
MGILFYENGLESTLKQMANPAMPAIEGLTVDAVIARPDPAQL